VENVHAMPVNGSVGNFKLGDAFGTIKCALAMLDIPYRLVTPGQWKKAMRVTADKDTARTRAIELWPAHASTFARKKDHGRAEAALIARWLYEQSRVKAAA
jgi:crossover junction endodeoxyribonuclease RuvC